MLCPSHGPFRLLRTLVLSISSLRPLAHTCVPHASHATSSALYIRGRPCRSKPPELPTNQQRRSQRPSARDRGSSLLRRLRRRCRVSIVRNALDSSRRYAGGHVPSIGSSSRSPLNPRTCSRSSATGHLLLEMRRNLFDVLRGGARTAAAAGRYQKNRKFVTWILLLRLTL